MLEGLDEPDSLVFSGWDRPNAAGELLGKSRQKGTMEFHNFEFVSNPGGKEKTHLIKHARTYVLSPKPPTRHPIRSNKALSRFTRDS